MRVVHSLDEVGLKVRKGILNFWVMSLVASAVLVGCAGGGTPSEQTLASTEPSSSVQTSPGHVFMIIMENRSCEEALGADYLSSLASQYAVATDYHAVAHPSLPNYLALTSGSTWGITDDAYHTLPSGEDLGSELTSAGIPWRAYMEDMSDGCFDSPYPYALKHNPFAYYGERCPSNVVPLSQLDVDLSGETPNFVWITPNLCNDGHDCGVSTSDQWLAKIVPKIMDSTAWKEDGVLFITWDEDDKQSGPNRVALVVVAPNLKSHQTNANYDHYSLLATIEDRLVVKRSGEAANAQAIEDLFQS